MTTELSNSDSQEKESNQGHPTLQRQHEIMESVKECYFEGLSAPAAAKRVGVNVKTAYKYYNEILESLRDESTKDLFAREKIEKIQAIATFDNNISESSVLLDKIKSEIQKYSDLGKPVPPALYAIELRIINFRFIVQDKKFSYLIRPTYEEVDQIEQRNQDVKP